MKFQLLGEDSRPKKVISQYHKNLISTSFCFEVFDIPVSHFDINLRKVFDILNVFRVLFPQSLDHGTSCI